MSRTCPSCGAQADAGRFCAGCGTAYAAPEDCRSCGAELPPGGRFCNKCGTPGQSARGAAASSDPAVAPGAGTSRRSTRELTPWIIAGVAVGMLLAVLVLPRLREPEPAPQQPLASTAGQMGDASAVDISSMTPRERADRLFNRVMQSVSSGDSAQARAFLPMALAAYEQVPDLDLDGRYHFAVLHLVDGDPASAREQAESILAVEPNHLFGHFTAAQAEQALGDSAAAAAHYRHFLDSYDAEISRELVEYRDHARVLPINRDEAQREVAGL